MIRKSQGEDNSVEFLNGNLQFGNNPGIQPNKNPLKDIMMIKFECYDFLIQNYAFCAFITEQHEVGYMVSNFNNIVNYFKAENLLDFVYDSLKVEEGYFIAHCSSYSMPIENILVFKRAEKDEGVTSTKGEIKKILYGSIRKLNETKYKIGSKDYGIILDYEIKPTDLGGNFTNLNKSLFIGYLDGVTLKKYKIGNISIDLNQNNFTIVKEWGLIFNWIDGQEQWKLEDIFMPEPYSTMGWVYIILAISLLLIPLILCWILRFNKEDKEKEKNFEEFKEKYLEPQIMGKKEKEKQIATELLENQKKAENEKKETVKLENKKRDVIGSLFRREPKDIDENKDYGFLEIME